MTHNKLTALVVEGGAMRSVFSAGLLDGFLAQQFNPFDFSIGVSAGACNLVSYLAGTPKQSLQIYLDFALQKEFISYRRFLRGGHLLDLDWITQAAFDATTVQLNADKLKNKPLYVCVTDVASGKPVYIKTTIDNIQSVLKASSALPVIYRGFPTIDDQPMTDGGVAEGIPVAEAIRMGASRIMVIRSRHKYYKKTDSLGHKFIRWKMRHCPALVTTMRERINIFNDSIALIRRPPPGVRIVEICPADDFKLGRFNRQRDRLRHGYQTGIDAAADAIAQWAAISTAE